MAHVEKYTKADVTGIFIHYDRTPGHELSNKDIDSSKTHLNYNLADHDQPLKQKSFLSKRLKEVITNGRKNQNVACDWIITQPQDVKENDSRKFFEEVYDYLAGMYGRKNIISSYVHMDEIGKRRDVFAFDFSDLVNKTTLLSSTDRFKFNDFRSAIRSHSVDFQSLECNYLIEGIYATL